MTPRLVFEPLSDWPYPPVVHAKSLFTANWMSTRVMLLRETQQLGARLVVIELDLSRSDLRQDGEIRAGTRLGSGRARLSMDTRVGHIRLACDRYHDGATSWQANVRAIALTLGALATVERHGAVHSNEQYQGFLMLSAGEPTDFFTADEAERWMRQQAGESHTHGPLIGAYRAAARRLHPDVGGDQAAWALLNKARKLLDGMIKKEAGSS